MDPVLVLQKRARFEAAGSGVCSKRLCIRGTEFFCKSAFVDVVLDLFCNSLQGSCVKTFTTSPSKETCVSTFMGLTLAPVAPKGFHDQTTEACKRDAIGKRGNLPHA